MGTTIKEALQKKFKKYYDTFLSIEINGVSFDVMPIQKDIPVIKDVFYNKETDELIISFETYSVDNKKIGLGEYLNYYVNEFDEITGFEISNIKLLLKDVNDKKLRSKFEIDHISTKSLEIKEAIKESHKKRNLNSIKEFLLQDAQSKLELQF